MPTEDKNDMNLFHQILEKLASDYTELLDWPKTRWMYLLVDKYLFSDKQQAISVINMYNDKLTNDLRTFVLQQIPGELKGLFDFYNFGKKYEVELKDQDLPHWLFAKGDRFQVTFNPDPTHFLSVKPLTRPKILQNYPQMLQEASKPDNQDVNPHLSTYRQLKILELVYHDKSDFGMVQNYASTLDLNETDMAFLQKQMGKMAKKTKQIELLLQLNELLTTANLKLPKFGKKLPASFLADLRNLQNQELHQYNRDVEALIPRINQQRQAVQREYAYEYHRRFTLQRLVEVANARFAAIFMADEDLMKRYEARLRADQDQISKSA